MCISIMCLIGLILLPVAISTMETYTKDETYFARRLTGHTIKTIISVSAGACHKECRLRSDCLSLNYNRRHNMCELNNYKYTGTQILHQEYGSYKEKKGWIYMNGESTILGDLGLCNGNTCKDGMVCRNGNCVTERCEPATNVPLANGAVLGNMNDIGSRIWIVCDAGYDLIGDDISECFEDGNWSSLPSCNPFCPVPLDLQDAGDYPTVVSANIYTSDGLLTDPTLINANTAVRENSEVVFDCSGGMYLQFPQKIFCHDGKWIYMPVCEEMGLGIDCAVDVSCSVQPQSNECVNRICRCPLGTSYSYSESRCIEQCPNGYADTFNAVKGVGQWGNYNLEVLKGMTREMCKAECISTVSFICRSFDYKYGYCYLQSVTYFDDPPSVFEWSGGAYFLRDCL